MYRNNHCLLIFDNSLAENLIVKPVALIVGGGRGIGADAAKTLAAEGFNVGVMSSSGKGAVLGKPLGGLGFTGSNLVPEDQSRFIDAAIKRFGRIRR